MSQTATQPSNAPSEAFIKAARAAAVDTLLIKAIVRVKPMRVITNRKTGEVSDVRDLVASFIDIAASEGRTKNVYQSVTCSMWGSEAQTKGDYLASFGTFDETRGDHKLECIIGLSLAEATRRTYTGQDSSENEVHQVKWMAIILDLTNTIVVGEKPGTTEPADLD